MKPQSLFYKQNKDIKRNTYVQHSIEHRGKGEGAGASKDLFCEFCIEYIHSCGVCMVSSVIFFLTIIVKSHQT